MRPIYLLAGLVAGGLFFASTPARADLGCACVKLGNAPVCMQNVDSCMKSGGVCLMVCDYQGEKKAMAPKAKKKKKKKA
jgi:hypothetical protein